MTKPKLEQGVDYERGFIDGMQKQMQSSVDKAVNRMTQPEQEQEPLTENGMYRLGYHNGYGFGEAYGKANAPQREFVGLTDEEIKAFDTWHDNREEEVGWCNPSEIVAYIEAKLKQKNGYAEEKNA